MKAVKFDSLILNMDMILNCTLRGRIITVFYTNNANVKLSYTSAETAERAFDTLYKLIKEQE